MGHSRRLAGVACQGVRQGQHALIVAGVEESEYIVASVSHRRGHLSLGWLHWCLVCPQPFHCVTGLTLPAGRRSASNAAKLPESPTITEPWSS